jgi:hypothetical protein
MDTKEPFIRLGMPEDFKEVMELCELATEENGFVNPNMDKVAQEIWAGLNQNYGVIGLVGKPGEKIEAGILIRVGNMWYSDGFVAEEKAIFVHPDYRSAKGLRAQALCNFSKKFADDLGIPLMIGVLSNQRTKSKIRLYERIFGEQAGAYFLYGAKTGKTNIQ